MQIIKTTDIKRNFIGIIPESYTLSVKSYKVKSKR